MTIKQKLIRSVYPALKLFNKLTNRNTIMEKSAEKAVASFYELETKKNDVSVFRFDTLKGKRVMIVNTASACGYTPQYDGLQHLYEQEKNDLVILGFPSNDFGAQEQANDEAIATFCKVNFGVTFPLM